VGKYCKFNLQKSKSCYKAIEVRERPDFIAVHDHYAWVIDDNNSLIKRLSVDNAKPLIAIKVPGACAAPVIAFEAVWVISCAEGKLYKIDKNTGRGIDKNSRRRGRSTWGNEPCRGRPVSMAAQ